MSSRNPESHPIRQFTPEVEKRVQKSPLLNIDTFIIPSPYIKEGGIELDYEHSFYWAEEGEILGCIQVYSDKLNTSFHIYKIVTSPFSRGRGIGTMFIRHLAAKIPEDALIYLYVWEKQPDTMEYFKAQGFTLGDTIVYRNLVYYHLSATPRDILETAESESSVSDLKGEDIGKARHDARKTLRLLSHMVDSLSSSNSGKIIEDINRETTTLINILNRFRDTFNRIHEVNLRDLIIERIVPYVEASSIPCRLHFSIDTDSSEVLGYYMNISRAIVNIVSNSLDAIKEKGEKGVLHIDLRNKGKKVVLRIKDNGIGMSSEMLVRGVDGLPAFVGKSTKSWKEGEGLGSVQIFSVFGKHNIDIKSGPGKGAVWTIRFDPPPRGVSERIYTQLERRFNEFQNLMEVGRITAESPRSAVISYIWQMRKMELYLYDVILQFSKYHNIRTIYRIILAYLQGRTTQEALKRELRQFEHNQKRACDWLYLTASRIRERFINLSEVIPLDEFGSQMFRSYGQAIDSVIIFTLDPETGKFLATDRKLAEHLDFAPYLGKDKEDLLRGEFAGDLNNHHQAITLGVWSISSREDLMRKLLLIQKGAKRLMELGLHGEKCLAFYQTTSVHSEVEVDPDASTTLEHMVSMSPEQLLQFSRHADTEMSDYLFIVD